MADQDQINSIKKELQDLKAKKSILQKQLFELENKEYCYAPSDLPLPKEMTDLKIYIPEKFYIYNIKLGGANKYVVEYDDNIFSIEHNPSTNSKYPHTFTINGLAYRERTPLSVPFFVYLYYSDPQKVHRINSLENSALTQFNNLCRRLLLKMRNEWNMNIYFGLILFHYWIRIYYKHDSSYPELHAAFEKVKIVS